MKASKQTSVIQPAVTEDRYVLELSEHEARMLRNLSGKEHRTREFSFLIALDQFFPNDYKINYGGVKKVTLTMEPK